jgi:CRP-like cAMP-binding protein
MEHVARNRLLRSLPNASRQAVMRECEVVDLDAGTILEEAGAPTKAAWFPESAVISTVASYGDGSTIEMANVGREACTGVNLVLGLCDQLTTNEVQISGTALRCPTESLLRLKSRHEDFRDALFAAVQAVFYQVMVSGACNGAHDTRQRLARWLLTMHDRTDGGEMRLTHEFLGHMLGLRRATVTEAASALQGEGLISYSHGRVEITDRPGLRRASCECYDLVRDAYDTLLPQRSDVA